MVEMNKDNLRDRIADVLADEFKRQGYACEWAVLADAVIEALGLKHYCRECGGWGPFDV